MYEKITITMKNENYATWEKGEWDDYFIQGNLFIVIKKDVQVGFYNIDCIKSIIVE